MHVFNFSKIILIIEFNEILAIKALWFFLVMFILGQYKIFPLKHSSKSLRHQAFEILSRTKRLSS